MNTFEEIGIGKDLSGSAREMGWVSPTPVQKAAVPAGLEGRDLVVRAQTGTGKTGTYALVALSRTEAGGETPNTLVIAPTRELAQQVDGEVRRLSKGTGHSCVAVYGGADYRKQTNALRRGADIVVGTPGRLRDMTDRGALDLSGIGVVVLDEADRMLDMGFEEDLHYLLERIPEERQTLFLSATMAPGVAKLAKSMTRDPEVIDVSSDSPVTGLTDQSYIVCSRSDKRAVLMEVLERGNPKTVVFCATKSMVDLLYEDMKEEKKVGTLHGNMAQKMRERVLEDFRDNRILTLVATDVAARGLDVPDIDLVVNFDAPPQADTYLHRIGRTGRAGRSGTAVTIITPREKRLIRMYEKETEVKIDNVIPDDLGPFEEEHAKIRKAPKAKREPRVRVPVKRRVMGKPDKVSIKVDLGKQDGLSRVSIADFVRDRSGLGEDEVGKVGLGKRLSFVEVPSDFAEAVIDAVDGSMFDGKKIRADFAPVKKPYTSTTG